MSKKDQGELLKALQDRTYLQRFEDLLQKFRTDELTMEEISQEVELVRQKRYDEGSIRYKVVIDTNIFISFLIGKVLKDLPKYLHSSAVELVVSDELISELIEVTSRPSLISTFLRNLLGNSSSW